MYKQPKEANDLSYFMPDTAFVVLFGSYHLPIPTG